MIQIETKVKRFAAIVAAVLGVAGVGSAVGQTPASPSVAVPADVLGIADIESRVTAEGIKVEEIEIRDLIAEVEGRDAQGREIDLVVDRRTGEILSRQFDD